MKKMTEVLVHLSGNLPRSEELFGVLRRYGRGKATWEEVRSTALAETSEWIRLERELGFNLLTDPMLLWHDHFRPFAERWSGLEVDGLARWFDNNLFYRVPVFRERPSGQGDVLAEYIFAEALRGRSAKLILPEPFTMVMLSNRRLQVSPEELAVDVARLLAEEATHFLKGTGLQVELLQLSAPYVVSRRLNSTEVDAVTESMKVLKRKTGLRVQLHTFFYSLGNARGWIEDAGADVVGFDATVTSLDEVLDSGLRGEVAVGIVDSRSSRVERPDEVMGLLRALADAGFTRIQLTTTTDLEYVPPEVARSKLGALREIREAFLERGG
jgi:5-methyltetrahydropteroyltriglutamate--homocysteine methyltransferase